MAVPGPFSLPLVGQLPALGRNPLGFFRGCARKYGPIARFRVLRYEVFLISSPDLFQEVLQTKAAHFIKSVDYRSLRPVFGNGLLTSEGARWQDQRRILQPAFNHSSLDRYVAIMRESAEEMLRSWKPGETRDIHKELMALTLQIVSRTLFQTEAPGRIDLISSAVSAVFRDLSAAAMFIPLLQRVPTPRMVRWRNAVVRLDGIIRGLIRDAQNASSPPGGLIGMLLNARDLEGQPLSEQQIRDELLTMFLAGHETTAVALSWTLYLLSQNERVEDEVRRELAGAELDSVAGVLSLPLTKAVLQESMRLYPPVWCIGREATSPVEIRGFDIPAGGQLWLCQWLLHHDEQLYANAAEFLPRRWDQESNTAHRFRYLPFGAGPRVCIGQSFAMLESAVILAAILSRFHLRLKPGALIEAAPWFTLRPRYGVPMIVS